MIVALHHQKTVKAKCLIYHEKETTSYATSSGMWSCQSCLYTVSRETRTHDSQNDRPNTQA